MSIESSTRCSQQNRTAWGWACRSAAPSSRPTRDGCGLSEIRREVRCSNLSCPSLRPEPEYRYSLLPARAHGIKAGRRSWVGLRLTSKADRPILSDEANIAIALTIVRFWHKPDVQPSPANVRFRGQSGHWSHALQCLLLTQSGHGPLHDILLPVSQLDPLRCRFR